MRADVLRRKDYTAEEAFWLSPPGRWELVSGEFSFVSPVGRRHGRLVPRVWQRLDEFVSARRLGEAVAGDVGFVLRRNPDTVRAPDVAFIRAERTGSSPPEEFFQGAPDLAIEVLSPSDRWPEVERKAREFLEAGSHAIWAVAPSTRSARVWDASGVRMIPEDGALGDPALLPGFSLALKNLFDAA